MNGGSGIKKKRGIKMTYPTYQTHYIQNPWYFSK